MDRHVSAVLIGAGVMALSGCIASARYPADWAEVRKSECADLSGSYENRGVMHYPTQMWSGPQETQPIWLASLFFKGKGRTLSDPQQASIVQIDARTPGRLGVTAAMPHGQAVTIELREDKEEFQCRTGRLELTSTDLGIAFVLVGASTVTHSLSKATDDALIVAGHDQLIGTALITVPVYWSSRSYARFGPAPESSAGASEKTAK